METFEKIIDFALWFSLGMSLIQLYLRANKIWKRKHERDVAESQSIAGLSLLLLNCTFWIASYIIKGDYESIIDTSIIMFEATVFLLIGTGLWIKGQKRLGLWTLFKQALRLERKEADYLLNKFFKPQNAEKIINILHQLAMIDEELNEKEKIIIESFAKEWNIPYSYENYENEVKTHRENRFIHLRKSLEDYLDRKPLIEQVAQLKDMIHTITQADEKVTEQEELIISELMGMIDNYIKNDSVLEPFHVIIVPQKPEHEEIIMNISPNATKIRTSGGVAYSIDSFYSIKYAEMICNEYRQINLFTIVHSPENNIEN